MFEFLNYFRKKKRVSEKLEAAFSGNSTVDETEYEANHIDADNASSVTSKESLAHLETVVKNIVALKNYQPIIDQEINGCLRSNMSVPAFVTDDFIVLQIPKSEWTTQTAAFYPMLDNRVRRAAKKENKAVRHVYVASNVLKSFIENHTQADTAEEVIETVQAVDAMLTTAINLGASDIHILCEDGFCYIGYRINGVYVDDQKFDYDQGLRIYNALLIRYCKKSEDGCPAKKGYFYRNHTDDNGHIVEWMFRVSYGFSDEETNDTRKMAIRLRNSQELPRLDELGYHRTQLKAFDLARFNRGFILFVGAVNSGKSTGMAAYLLSLPSGIVILEISAEREVKIPGVTQLTLPSQGRKEDIEEYRSRFIELPMQSDCDCLVVNEINSQETSDMIAQMMMQGTSGLSCIHGSGWAHAINRMLGVKMGMDDTVIFSEGFFNLIVTQTLVGRLCEYCKLDSPPSKDLEHALRKVVPKSYFEHFRYHNPEGCEHCEVKGLRTGVSGRQLIAEVLPIVDGNRALLRDRTDLSKMRQWMVKNGVLTLHQHGLMLARQGIIDPLKTQVKIGAFSRENLNVVERKSPAKRNGAGSPAMVKSSEAERSHASAGAN